MQILDEESECVEKLNVEITKKYQYFKKRMDMENKNISLQKTLDFTERAALGLGALAFAQMPQTIAKIVSVVGSAQIP